MHTNTITFIITGESPEDIKYRGFNSFFLTDTFKVSSIQFFLVSNFAKFQLNFRKRTNTSTAKTDDRVTEYMMKFLAHRNGDDYQNYHKSGEYICGTNIKIVSFFLIFS